MTEVGKPKEFSGPSYKIQTDPSRDSLLTDFGKKTLSDRYTLPGESYQDVFARVAVAYSDDEDHAQRLYDYMSKHWFMPSTPILSNGGTNRGLPISCFLNSVEDSLEGIQATWNENTWLARNGGGIGTYWGNVRSIGEKVGEIGKTSGVIPFIHVMDSLTLAISQGSLRRGSAAVYLDIDHPEIEEFLEIRKPGGDVNRKSLNIHHGVGISDVFMEAVRNDEEYDLKSPKTGEVMKTLSARYIWQKLLETRLQTGEPYILFTDTAQRGLAKHQQELGLRTCQSNLCAEINLVTGRDHLGNDRSAVCCLSSVNAVYYNDWANDPLFIEDVLRFLDNVLEDFIRRAPNEMARARYAAMRERSVGLGLMGFHSFLQQNGIPFEGVMAKSWNMRIFKNLRAKADEASYKLAVERGPNPDAAERGVMERFSHKLSIAPTASISIIAGGTSAGIEPIITNYYTHKTLSGTFAIKNQDLEKLLEEKGLNTDVIWNSILENEGSVQHLEELDEFEKDVFKTAFELDQRWIVEFAGDRAPSICQGQSVNLFLPSEAEKEELHYLHAHGWSLGVKSFYYVRSKSIQRASFAGSDKECLSCQ